MSDISNESSSKKKEYSSIRIAVVPHIKTRQHLFDEVARTIWYFEPLFDQMDRVELFYAQDDIDPSNFAESVRNIGQEIEDYFDPMIPVLAKKWADKLRLHFDPNGQVVKGWNEDCQALVVTDKHDGETKAIVDAVASQIGLVFITASVEHNIGEAANRAFLIQHFKKQHWQDERRARGQSLLRSLSERVAGRPVNLYGSGPSMSQLVETGHDFGDVAHIICNSMVNNKELLSLIEPAAVVCADPVFHAGPSRYAAEFRSTLNAFMHEHPSVCLVTTVGLLPNILTGLDEANWERTVGIDTSIEEINLDLLSKFEVEITENILTMLMLPLAYSITDNVQILGCDGRRFKENGYFWAHDKKSQFDDHLTQTQRVHKAFFAARNYDGYYLAHCRVLENYLTKGEALGKAVQSLTPSRVPPLAKRYKVTF